MVDALLSVASQVAEEDGDDVELYVLAYKTSSSSSIRRCEFCKSTETPAWRRGPAGKGSLCNACGIKWRLKKKVKKNDGGSSWNDGKRSQSMRKAVGRPPKKHSKIGKHFLETKRFFCKSCSTTTEIKDFGNDSRFEMRCCNCSKKFHTDKKEDGELRESSNPNHYQSIAPSQDAPPNRDLSPSPGPEALVARLLNVVNHGLVDVTELMQVLDELQSMKSELLMRQNLGRHEDQLAAIRANTSRELNDLKARAFSRIREVERMRIAQINNLVGSLFANISACEQFQQEIISRSALQM